MDNKQSTMSGIVRKKTGKNRVLAQCALFVVLMVVAAFIRIPFPLVPLTFQTAVAVSAGLLLGPAAGAASMGVYLFMGLLGLPVFAGGGGFAYVLELTFGYLLGFVAAAFVAGAVRGGGRLTFARAAMAALAGCAVNYLVGVPYFVVIWHFYMQNGGLWRAVLLYNVAYLPKDIALCFLAAAAVRAVRAALSRRS